jgi:two-component system, NarL family, sensor histidine kinase DevS
MAAVPDALDEHALRRLLDAGRTLVGELDLDTVLDRLLGDAADLTGAQYAALGVLDRRRERLERFRTRGADEEVHRAIGAPPTGRGLLGALIADPRPLRVASLRDDPRSYGFPPGHPQMKSFLGVPLLVRGEAWGNLYLTDRAGGEPFTQADEDAVVVLAAWAGVAIANARAYQDSERRRAELAASTAIALAVSSGRDAQQVLELIVTRGRDLVGARGVAILLREDGALRPVARAGELPAAVLGAPIRGGPSDVRATLGLSADEGLLVPLVHDGRSVGLLVAAGLRPGEEDEQLLCTFAAHAATAVANARKVEARRLGDALRAAEAERSRWARELHDEPLQGLGALRLLLVGARRSRDPQRLAAAVDAGIERLESEIDALRRLVRELRPAALDELGLGPALEGLAERTDLRVDMDVRLGDRRLPADAEVAAYRIVQEALNNALRHAGATAVAISVYEEDGTIHVEVCDDGRGFDLDAPAAGFGLGSMRERVELLGGELEIESSTAGTRLTAILPEVSR